MTRRMTFVAALCAVAAVRMGGSAQDLTQRDADNMERKITAIEENGNVPEGTLVRTLQTTFTDREVNAYLKFNGQGRVPKGIKEPTIVVTEGGRLEGRALVDLDAVRTSKPRSWYDPANLLSGIVAVKASGVLQTVNGRGTFELQSATFGGLPLSKSMLQELVAYYSKTPESPNGFDMDKPFDLPARVREVRIQRGSVTVIQ